MNYQSFTKYFLQIGPLDITKPVLGTPTKNVSSQNPLNFFPASNVRLVYILCSKILITVSCME